MLVQHVADAGSVIPDIVLWLSYFYTNAELPMRLAGFWTTCGHSQSTDWLTAHSMYLADIFSAFIGASSWA